MTREQTSGKEGVMRRLAALVMFVAILTLFVAVVTRTEESRSPDRGTTTVLMVAVECPCGGECEAHAKVASDLELEYAEAEGCVLKLPVRNVVGQRSDTQVNDESVVVCSRLIEAHGYDTANHGSRSWYSHDVIGNNRERGVRHTLKLPRRGGCLNVNDSYGTVYMYDTNAASARTGRFSAGVL